MLPKEYLGVGHILGVYLAQYGGKRAIFRSPYFHLSIILLIPTIGIWSERGWWDLPIAILPSLISFTLAGYALFMGFGDEKFRRLMAGGEDQNAPMLAISATFTHFIVVQVLAVILALIAKARPVSSIARLLSISLDSKYFLLARHMLGLAFWMGSFLVFLYSLCCVIATTLSVFRVTRWFNQHQA